MKTNEKATKQGIVPALRFPEFSDAGEWIYLEGNKVFEQISNRKHSSNLPVLAISQEYGAVPRDLIDYKVIVSEEGIENYKVVEIGDFIISLRSFQGGIEYSAYNGICSPAYIILRKRLDVDNQFFKYYFKSRAFIRDLNKNLEGIRDGKMVSYKQFSEILLPIPSIHNKKEQQKIADCLSSIDALIKTAEHKIDELKVHKKGLMQQLFPAEGKTVPQYRFPEFRDTGEWKSYAITNFFSRLTLRNNENNDNILTISAQYGLVSQKKYFNKLVAAENISNYFLLHKSDFAYNKSSSQAYPQGAIKCLKLYDKGIVSPLYICLKIKNINEVSFFEHFFEAGMINSEIKNIAQEGARNHGLLNVGVKDFFNQVSFTVPKHFEERKKIADCLSSVDDLIMAQTNRLEALKAHKKGLMQQLFPNLNDVKNE